MYCPVSRGWQTSHMHCGSLPHFYRHVWMKMQQCPNDRNTFTDRSSHWCHISDVNVSKMFLKVIFVSLTPSDRWAGGHFDSDSIITCTSFFKDSRSCPVRFQVSLVQMWSSPKNGCKMLNWSLEMGSWQTNGWRPNGFVYFSNKVDVSQLPNCSLCSWSLLSWINMKKKHLIN